MRKFVLSMGAMMLAIAGFAQVTGSLNPESGHFYANDAVQNGRISAFYTDTIVATGATATVAGTAVTVEDVSKRGFFIPVPALADGSNFTVAVSGVTDDAGTAVANLSGTYTYHATIPVGNIAPASGTVTNKAQTVVFTFTENVTCTSIVITSGEKTTETPYVAGPAGINRMEVAITANNWGTPVGGYNHLQVALKGVSVVSNSTPISNSPGSVGTISANYTIADAPATVTYLGVDPEPDWTYAEDVMGWTATFLFSDAVTMTNTAATAVIDYLDELEDPIAASANVPMADITGALNPRTGQYGLFVPVPAAPIYDPGAVLAYMTITLQGITYNGSAVTLPAPLVSYEATPVVVFRAPATHAIQTEKTAVNENVDIYSMQGILLKKDVPASTVNTLGKGMYIVGNKKVFVK